MAPRVARTVVVLLALGLPSQVSAQATLISPVAGASFDSTRRIDLAATIDAADVTWCGFAFQVAPGATGLMVPGTIAAGVCRASVDPMRLAPGPHRVVAAYQAGSLKVVEAAPVTITIGRAAPRATSNRCGRQRQPRFVEVPREDHQSAAASDLSAGAPPFGRCLGLALDPSGTSGGLRISGNVFLSAHRGGR
jgi:hypothetical protein